VPSSKDKDGPTPPKKQIHFFCIDNELVYWNFFLDFGPLNLGQLTRFCKKVNDKLRKFPAVCFYSCTEDAKRANAIFLICAWQMLYLDRTPEQSYAGFDRSIASALSGSAAIADASQPPVSNSQGAPTIAPLPDFHDASPCQCTYDLTVLDCLKGFAKARLHGFFDMETFDVEEYEYFEQVEVRVLRHENDCVRPIVCRCSYLRALDSIVQNGDLNWIIKDKILAFAGPSFERHVSPEGYCTLSPSDYIPYFQQKNVGLVVRLNKKCYNEQDFVDAGIDHVEAFFVDGSCPSLDILHGVIDAFEQVPPDRSFAVHCKAGLGRTGTCIGGYLMKHYGFTAKEAIAWMRICRPGCVIGPQQQYLERIQQLMWDEGVAAGYIEMPQAGRPNAKSASSSKQSAVVGDTEMEDAVVGRAGQAEALLAARAGRSNGKAASTTPPSSTPVTPEARDKSAIVAVTPDSAAAPSMWCT
jgi:cell division cycle 14